MHGPALSKNPLLADYILSKAVQNKYGESLVTEGQEAAAELDKVSMLAARASIAADEAASHDQYS
jgi:CobQ-like glutamine amidotransferase family enzyme